jgi:hypothetical protein
MSSAAITRRSIIVKVSFIGEDKNKRLEKS